MPHCLFGRHVEDRAHDLALAGHARRHRERQSEVHQLGHPVFGQCHVLRFQVTVDDPVPMGVLQAFANLTGDVQYLFQAFGFLLSQRTPFHQLHDDVWATLILSSIVHADDVGMVQLGDDTGFAQQAGAALRTDFGAGHEFNRHLSLQHRIECPVDGPHAALTQFFNDMIALVDRGSNQCMVLFLYFKHNVIQELIYKV
ncbi:MAG: hypothetical protein PVG32_03110 [Anaerolineales bacterium]